MRKPGKKAALAAVTRLRDARVANSRARAALDSGKYSRVINIRGTLEQRNLWGLVSPKLQETVAAAVQSICQQFAAEITPLLPDLDVYRSFSIEDLNEFISGAWEATIDDGEVEPSFYEEALDLEHQCLFLAQRIVMVKDPILPIDEIIIKVVEGVEFMATFTEPMPFPVRGLPALILMLLRYESYPALYWVGQAGDGDPRLDFMHQVRQLADASALLFAEDETIVEID